MHRHQPPIRGDVLRVKDRVSSRSVLKNLFEPEALTIGSTPNGTLRASRTLAKLVHGGLGFVEIGWLGPAH
jgi:hypothetical protein